MRSCDRDTPTEKQNVRATINHEVTGNIGQAVVTYYKTTSYRWQDSASNPTTRQIHSVHIPSLIYVGIIQALPSLLHPMPI